MKSFLALVCVVASLLFLSGCGPVPSTPSAGSPAIYAFSMPGCFGCARDKPRLAELERVGYSVLYIDITTYPEWRRMCHIEEVPLYFVVRSRRIVLRTHDLNLVIRMLQNGSSV